MKKVMTEWYVQNRNALKSKHFFENENFRYPPTN